MQMLATIGLTDDANADLSSVKHHDAQAHTGYFLVAIKISIVKFCFYLTLSSLLKTSH